MASYARATMPTPRKARRVGNPLRARRAARSNGRGVISFIRGPRPPGGGYRATGIAVSFEDVGGMRQLGVARMGRIPRGLVLFPGPGDGVLRDPSFRGRARRLAALQISHRGEGCRTSGEPRRDAGRIEAR